MNEVMRGKYVVLAVTGSIAVYKVIELARRMTQGNEALGLPIFSEPENAAHVGLTKQRCAHPAGSEPFGMCREEEILRCHRRALYGHQIFGAAPRCVGVSVHWFYGESDDDHDCCADNAPVGALHIVTNGCFRIAVASAIVAKPRSHGQCQRGLACRIRENEVAPWLAVMRGGCPAGADKNAIEHIACNGLRPIPANTLACAEQAVSAIAINPGLCR